MPPPSRLPRRTLIQCSLGALGTSLVFPHLTGCSGSTASIGLKPWSTPQAEGTDVRLASLGYSILAPSAHNSQPWAVGLRGADTIDLYVDQTRLLPEVDPLYRQAHVSQGR